MQCYTELLPPSTVTHAVTLPFLSAAEENLVVAKTSLLQVYKLRAVPGGVYTNGGAEDGGNTADGSKLCLIGEYALSGTVTALRRIKTLNSKSGGEALLVGTKNAKLSLVEWDPENYRISTLSIHYYESENILMQPFGPDLRDTESILTVDPSSRCAALKFGQRHLAILPFRQLGDDLVEMDIDGEAEEKKLLQPQLVNGDGLQTPYKASFVSALTQIAPDLTHPIDLEFLYEYREPTLGILASASQASSALLDVRKDTLSYTVGTLDLEQRASTVLVSVQSLPSDLWKVVPLPLPIGGALLVGNNEFVHVDQSGKTNAVAVNEFAKLGSDFGMADQSQLALKLEDCEIAPLGGSAGDLLIALRDGSLAILRFIMQGRNVGGMQIASVPHDNGGLTPESAPSCIAAFGTGEYFFGSDVGDSVLIRGNSPPSSLSRKRSHGQMLGKDADAEDDEADDIHEEDDLYGSAPATTQRTHSGSSAAPVQPMSAYRFQELDRLPSHGPINSLCFGKPVSGASLEAVAAVGKGQGSRLAFMTKEIVPQIARSSVIGSAKNLWSIGVKPVGLDTQEMPSEVYDNTLFVYDGLTTKAFSRPEAADSDASYIERPDTEFEQEGETVDIGLLANRSRVVQCRQTEIRIYDADLALSQIIPMLDEETDAELKIVHTSFCDPYLLVLREDSSVQLLQVEKSGDVEPLETESDALSGHKWLSGCLYNGSLTHGDTAAFLLRDGGSMHAFSLPDLKPIYSALNTPHLPPVLYGDATQRRLGAKETLTEVVVADLGPVDAAEPYLVLRGATDALTIYEPFHYPTTGSSSSWFANLRFRKVPNTYMPRYEETIDDGMERVPPLRPFRVAGYRAISVPGISPGCIMRHASSLPKVLPLRLRDCKAVTAIYNKDCDRGYATLDTEGNIRECQFPADAWFGSGWIIRKMAIGEYIEDVRHIAFHEERGLYVVGTCRPRDFMFAEDDGRHPDQDDISLRPQVPQYSIHLLSAKTHRVIHSFELPYTETITQMKVMPLEASELTHEQKTFVVVGSAQRRGEDMPAKGAISVFEILDVVPEPNDEESGVQLHLVAREEPRGAVTAIESFAGGLIGTAQGQKLMVRGLKEDGSCLPVAFLDAQCQMVTLKTLARSGMWLAGDVWKGLWFGGFTEEPFKLTVLGKSRTHMEVVCAEFLPMGGELYILVVDADMNLHVLQYDPENPKSLSGMRLLHRSTFHLGHFPTSMTLVPSTLAPFAVQQEALSNGHGDDEMEDTPASSLSTPLFHVLVTTQTGSTSLITPVDETTYRRLAAVEQHLLSVLEHSAGLNPKDYRAIESEGFGARGVIDGSIVQRISELGSAKRAEVLSRAGSDIWQLRSDLEIIAEGGLGWL